MGKLPRTKLFLVVASLLLLITGCGSGNVSEPSSANNAQEQEQPLRVTIAGGAAGGAWSTIGEGIGVTIKRAYPGSTFTYAPGQDGTNIITVMNGQAEFGMVTVPAAKWALEGSEPFSQKIEDVRAVAFLHSQPYHFVVTEDSGIQSIEDIVENNYPFVAAVNTKDSPMEIASRVAFESYGTSYEEIEKNGGNIQFVGISKVGDLVKDGKMQGMLTPLPAP